MLYNLSAEHFFMEKHRHARLLDGNRCLLIFKDPDGVFSVVVESLDALDNAISSHRFKRQFHQNKLGPRVVMAFDESKRILAMCAANKVSILP